MTGDWVLSADPDGDDWIPALVPGGVHESLIAAGRLTHPFLAEHERDAQWVAEQTWWFRTQVDVPAEPSELVFHGLDTVVTGWLDGEEILQHSNMFVPLTVDLTGRPAGPATLLLRFTPPLEGLEAPAAALESAERLSADFDAQRAAHDLPSPPEDSGWRNRNLAIVRRRKATFSWGWDFAPVLPSVGVWRPVELRPRQLDRIAGVHARTTAVDVEGRTARVLVDVEVEGAGAVEVELVAPDGGRTPLTPGVETTVTDAQLWWTHDLGEQPLYDVVVRLGDQEATTRIGLRTVELDRSPDEVEGGRFFRLRLNGFPVFCRGANWVPASMFVGSVTDQRLRATVAAARRGEMTMIRVWGGGVYEPHAFFDACDELGLLVWQDFMFACADYPDTDADLVREVTAEAAAQVRRLRNHASLALWCGNNEVHALHQMSGGSVEDADWGRRFFHEVLPAAVAEHSPGAIYWPGSPWASDDPKGFNGVADGDRHAWEVWHGLDVGAGGPTEFASHAQAVHFDRYRHDKGRFISEFGIHAAPDLHTLERWTEPGSLALGSPALLHRNKDNPTNKGDALMSLETGLPHDLRTYVDHSMAAQAEGLKLGVEHYRRRQPHCSGTLVWQLNDPWPGLTWSVLDHDLVGKAGYWFLQRAYQPVIATLRHEAGRLEAWVTNSSREAVDLDLRVEVPLFAGGTVLDETVRAAVGAAESRCVWSAEVEAGPDRFAWVSGAGVEPNRLFFGHLKDLPLREGSVKANVGPVTGGTVEVEVEAVGYAYFVAVTAPEPGLVCSRNYLDLRDGERATITVSALPEGFDPSTLLVRSWSSA